ncbi:MAG: hypothetical protein R2818_11475 [Flavobacteriales bacterium]
MAQQLRAPVALICTSGSAVLNYGPAITEAFTFCSACDHPPTDRRNGWIKVKEQAIRQQGVLSLHMRRAACSSARPADELSRWHY